MSDYISLLVVVACVVAASVANRDPRYRWLRKVFAAGGFNALAVVVARAVRNAL